MEDHRQLMDANREHWSELVPIHRDSEFYDLASFKAGRSTVDELSLQLLGDLEGKSLLHLQCHFGMDTLSLARAGARVTGVDFSHDAIELARELAAELEIEAHFIEANVYDLPDTIDDQFDIVFTSHGTIIWLPDIEEWARIVARALKPGGRFVFLDGHPFAWIFDQSVTDGYAFEFGYFNTGQTFEFDEEGSYADLTAQVANRKTNEWHHQLGNILNALIGAGLVIEHVGEYPKLAWKMLPFMEKDADGWWRLPESYLQLPLMLSITARHPA